MVCSHRCSAEESTTTPLFPQAPEHIWNESPHPPLILHLHCGKHPDWLHNCLVWQHQQQSQNSAMGCADCPPQCRRWASLPPGHLHQAEYEESPEDHQWLQPPKPRTVLSAALRKTVTQYPITHKSTEGQLFPSDYQAAEHSEVTLTQHTSLSIPFTFNSTTNFYQLDFNVACTTL